MGAVDVTTPCVLSLPQSASEQLSGLVSELPLLWIVAGMAILAFLTGLFTFCVRRKVCVGLRGQYYNLLVV